MIDILTTFETILAVIGGASILLKFIAPMTENKKDDKILAVINRILSVVSLDKTDDTLRIKLKR